MEKKIQSAMEYLMTYGWAILIISVVLVVLFSLGITNPLFFAPKATAGGCQVVRTSVAQSLEGICNGEIPQYVAKFNGQNSYILLPPTLTTNKGVTLSAWFYSNAGTGGYGRAIVQTGTSSGFGPALENGEVQILESGITWFGTGQGFSTGKWYNIIISALPSGSNVVYDFYINGKYSQLSGASLPTPPEGNGAIGEEICCGHFFKGYIANVQIYNASLSGSETKALYREGIGGAPIVLQNLVGWWPLNGNANDYSGNNNDGTASNVIWSGTWWQSYTAP